VAVPKIIYTIKFDSFYLFLILNLPISLKIRGFSPDSGTLDDLLIYINFRELPECRNLLYVILIVDLLKNRKLPLQLIVFKIIHIV